MNKMNLEVETDKRLNVYQIWEGKQIMLCKNSEKGTMFKGKKWVILWPSTSDENRMKRHHHPTEATEFYPSEKGFELLEKYRKESKRDNCYIASVEYFPCNGKSRRLWEKLEEIGEFELWDIVLGPLKYFENKQTCYIAIYMVYKMPIFINRDDLVPDRNGNLPTYHKKINEEKTETVFSYIDEFKLVLSDEVFEARKNKIIQLIKDTWDDSPYNYSSIDSYIKSKYPHETILDQDTKLTNIYCIYCGQRLPSSARFCRRCGRKAEDIE
jgi:hypothetical protein